MLYEVITTIIMQLLVIVFPTLKKIQEEEGGRKKIQRYSRYATVVVCLIQSYTVTVYAQQIPDAIVMDLLPYTLIAMLTVTTVITSYSIHYTKLYEILVSMQLFCTKTSSFAK